MSIILFLFFKHESGKHLDKVHEALKSLGGSIECEFSLLREENAVLSRRLEALETDDTSPDTLYALVHSIETGCDCGADVTVYGVYRGKRSALQASVKCYQDLMYGLRQPLRRKIKMAELLVEEIPFEVPHDQSAVFEARESVNYCHEDEHYAFYPTKSSIPERGMMGRSIRVNEITIGEDRWATKDE